MPRQQYWLQIATGKARTCSRGQQQNRSIPSSDQGVAGGIGVWLLRLGYAFENIGRGVRLLTAIHRMMRHSWGYCQQRLLLGTSDER